MYYDPYNLDNLKTAFFSYQNKIYNGGTKILFNGECILNGEKVYLNNMIVIYMYRYKSYEYFKYNNEIYMCPWSDFEKCIVRIITDENKTMPVVTQTEIYWTDNMVAKTIWYVVIMALATIFNDRIAIWLVATVIWYGSTFKKN